MTEEFFIIQVERLKSRFGKAAFDWEFIRVIGVEVATMPDEAFRRSVDTWIGTRKNNNPPLLTDFREARLAHERYRFEDKLDQANKTFQFGLKDVLRKYYKVDTLDEALELERHKLRMGDRNEGEGIK